MEDFEKLPKMAGWPGADITVPTSQLKTIESIKPNHTITFHNTPNGSGDPVGILDFNGPYMKFEGNADESAVVFLNFVAEHFSQRLKDEYQRGYNDARKEMVV